MGDEGVLFESTVMPRHSELSDNVLPWLVEECRQSGIELITHLSIEGGGGYGRLVAKQYPEWNMEFLRNENGENASFEHWPAHCPRSPYLELYEEFVREIIGTLGLRGLWFDSAPLSTRKWVAAATGVLRRSGRKPAMICRDR